MKIKDKKNKLEYYIDFNNVDVLYFNNYNLKNSVTNDLINKINNGSKTIEMYDNKELILDDNLYIEYIDLSKRIDNIYAASEKAFFYKFLADYINNNISNFSTYEKICIELNNLLTDKGFYDLRRILNIEFKTSFDVAKLVKFISFELSSAPLHDQYLTYLKVQKYVNSSNTKILLIDNYTYNAENNVILEYAKKYFKVLFIANLELLKMDHIKSTIWHDIGENSMLQCFDFISTKILKNNIIEDNKYLNNEKKEIYENIMFPNYPYL